MYVEWIDSGFSLLADKWQEIEYVKELPKTIKPIKTTGFLIEETEKWIILAQSIAESEEEIRGGYIILKSNIIKSKILK